MYLLKHFHIFQNTYMQIITWEWDNLCSLEFNMVARVPPTPCSFQGLGREDAPQKYTL